MIWNFKGGVFSSNLTNKRLGGFQYHFTKRKDPKDKDLQFLTSETGHEFPLKYISDYNDEDILLKEISGAKSHEGKENFRKSINKKYMFNATLESVTEKWEYINWKLELMRKRGFRVLKKYAKSEKYYDIGDTEFLGVFFFHLQAKKKKVMH